MYVQQHTSIHVEINVSVMDSQCDFIHIRQRVFKIHVYMVQCMLFSICLLLPPANEVWGQGYVFTRVSHSVHRVGGSCKGGGLHPGGGHLILWHTANERAVRILLECILVQV